jgi:hypothetical protein
MKFFIDFIKHLLHMATSRPGIKSKLLSVSEKLNIINKMQGVLNILHTQIIG